MEIRELYEPKGFWTRVNADRGFEGGTGGMFKATAHASTKFYPRQAKKKNFKR